MQGSGLVKGMSITLRRFFGKKITVQYPDARLPMSPRFRGGFLELDAGKCIACSLCAMSCPNHAISLTAEKGEGNKRRLTSYIHHTGQCLFCNLCLEACPVGALAWSKDYDTVYYDLALLDHDVLAAAQQRLAAAAPQPAPPDAAPPAKPPAESPDAGKPTAPPPAKEASK